ncbi:endospore germination permease [Paenibacillus cremeus]|nr:endospore germination permease [Paenibacillus cremeus]
MLRNKKITALQMYCILMLSIGISNHVWLIPVLLQVAKRDSWVGACAAIVPILLWICVFYLIVKRVGNRKLTDMLRQQYGKTVQVLIVSILSIYSFVISVLSLRDTVTWTNVSYLPATPRGVLAVMFMLVCFFAARAGIRAIGVTSGLLLPVVVVLGYLVATANFQYKDYSLLKPLFTHGYMPMLRAAMDTFGALLELVFILLMQHHVSTKIRFSSLVIFAIILIGLTIGPLTGSIAIFGPFQSADLRYPAFEQWRMVRMGKFISHLDFLSIYQWISGAFVRISLMLYLISDLAGIRRERNRTILLGCIAVFTVVLTIIPMSDMKFFQLLKDWYYPSTVGLNLFMTVVIFGLVILAGNRKENPSG